MLVEAHKLGAHRRRWRLAQLQSVLRVVRRRMGPREPASPCCTARGMVLLQQHIVAASGVVLAEGG